MYTTTVVTNIHGFSTSLDYPHETEAEAEAFVEGFIASAVRTSTGGNLADWHHVTLYYASTTDNIELVTTKH